MVATNLLTPCGGELLGGGASPPKVPRSGREGAGTHQVLGVQNRLESQGKKKDTFQRE